MNPAPELVNPVPPVAKDVPTQPNGSPAAVLLIAVVSGGLFGFGLALSTMVQPEVVLSFLRFQDFGLTLVMGGAVGVAALGFWLLPRWRARPSFADRFHRHTSQWNKDTLRGSALFGVGWGLCGVCPGPAIAAIGTGNWAVLWALAGIALGALAQGLMANR